MHSARAEQPDTFQSELVPISVDHLYTYTSTYRIDLLVCESTEGMLTSHLLTIRHTLV